MVLSKRNGFESQQFGVRIRQPKKHSRELDPEELQHERQAGDGKQRKDD